MHNKLESINIANSILFLGAGFSGSAKNILKENLPRGRELQEKLAEALGVESSNYDLKTLADALGEDDPASLYKILYNSFTVSELTPSQEYILNLPWKRIYTTNYDDAVEFCMLQNKKFTSLPSYSYNTPKPNKLPMSSVIHLHGVVRDIKEDNALDQIILGGISYAQQFFEKSDWYRDFIQDLRFCHHCFFIGYSNNDAHIQSLLLQNENTQKRTFFITRSAVDKIQQKTLERYGTILPVEIDGFVDLCKTLPKVDTDVSPYSLKAFKYVDPHKDKKTLSNPTPTEIINLYAYGKFNFQRFLSTYDSGQYVIPRSKLLKDAKHYLIEENYKCLLVHSRIGNGKSIFCEMLAVSLSENNYSCVFMKAAPVIESEDIERLRKFDKLVILIDSYEDAVEHIQYIEKELPYAKFVVTIRSSIKSVRMHEVKGRLPAKFYQLDINQISDSDKEAFVELANKAGISNDNTEAVALNAYDVRDIIVPLYDNQYVREQIENNVSALLQNPSIKQIFITSQILKTIGVEIDPILIRYISNKDIFHEFSKNRELVDDFFDISDDQIIVRSSILSDYVLKYFIGSQDILDSIFKVITVAVRNKAQRKNQAIISSLIKPNKLKDLLKEDPDCESRIETLFEKLRLDSEVNQEPLFWLQYSILMSSQYEPNLEMAERYIYTAYDRAKNNPSFKTFQIDTYALKLFLRLETEKSDSGDVKRFDDIVEMLEKIRQMIGDITHRWHALSTLESLETFINTKISVLTMNQKNVLTYHINLLLDRLKEICPDEEAILGSRSVKESLERALNILLS